MSILKAKYAKFKTDKKMLQSDCIKDSLEEELHQILNIHPIKLINKYNNDLTFLSQSHVMKSPLKMPFNKSHPP